MSFSFSLLNIDSKSNNCDFMSNKDLLKQLGIDYLLYSSKIDILSFITDDESVLKNRVEIIEDVMSSTNLQDMINSLIELLSYIDDLKKLKDMLYDSETHLYSVKEIEIYISCIELIDKSYSLTESIKSNTLKGLFTYIHGIKESEEYNSLIKGVEKLTFSITHIKSITVGYNFNEDLSLKEAGILSINTEPIKSSGLIEKIMAMGLQKDEYTSLAPLTSVKKKIKNDEKELLDLSFYSAINKLFKNNIRQWMPIIRNYLVNNTNKLINILPELKFLSESARILNELKEKGLPLCRPVIAPKESKKFTIKQCYNPSLAQTIEKSSLVFNDFTFDDEGMIYILTGPNRGGKSVFTCTIGIIQLFMQLGLLIPAKYAEISPVDCIFTHFPTAGISVNTNDKGRLGEECERLRYIIDKITPYSLILLDETMSSTDAYEASYIAIEIIAGISSYGCKCIYSTHLHEISNMMNEINNNPKSLSKIDSLVVGIENGKRSYIVNRTKSDGRSYAVDIARQYKLSYDDICNKY